MSIKSLKNIKPVVLFGASVVAILVATPSVFAQTPSLSTFQTTLGTLGNIVNTLTGIAVGVAFLYFFWQLAKYLKTDAGNKADIAKNMAMSLIVIVVITSLWGVVAFIRATVGIEDDVDAPGSITIPTVSAGSGGNNQGNLGPPPPSGGEGPR